jgi:hypothetical protein
VVVCIDQARQDNMPADIQHFIGFIRQCVGRTHLLYKTVANKKTTIRDLPTVVVHGY